MKKSFLRDLDSDFGVSKIDLGVLRRSGHISDVKIFKFYTKIVISLKSIHLQTKKITKQSEDAK